MRDAFTNPPATLNDTFVAALEHASPKRPLSGDELKLVRKAVAYTYVSAVARMTALVPQEGALACNKNPVSLQVLGESLQVLQEVDQFVNAKAPQERRCDG